MKDKELRKLKRQSKRDDVLVSYQGMGSSRNISVYFDEIDTKKKGWIERIKDSKMNKQKEKFFKAIEKNDERRITRLLKHKFDINTTDQYGNTAIDILCAKCRDEHGNITTEVMQKVCSLNLLRFLIKNDAKPDTMVKVKLRYNYFEEPILVFAIEMEDDRLVNLLLSKDVDVDIEKGDYDTALNVAAKLNNISIVDLLLKNGANVDHIGKNSDTALHSACRNENVSMVKLLIQHGANVNLVNDQNETPLVIATLLNDSEMVNELIKNNADPNIKKNHRVSVLDMAIDKNNLEVAEIYLKTGVEFDVSNKNLDNFLAYALINKREDLVQEFLKLDSGEISRPKLINVMLSLRNTELVRKLIKNSIFTDKDGELLQTAIINNEIDIAEELIEKGIPVNIRFEYLEETPLMLAVEGGQKELVRFLLEKGADVDLADIYGDNSLHIACNCEDVEIFNMVVDKCSDINKKNKDDEAPIHIVCENGNARILEGLIEKGADINQPTSIEFTTNTIVGKKVERGYKTPLYVAAQNNNKECIEMLVNNGADVEKDLMVALQRSNVKIVKEIVKYIPITPENEDILNQIKKKKFNSYEKLRKSYDGKRKSLDKGKEIDRELDKEKDKGKGIEI